MCGKLSWCSEKISVTVLVEVFHHFPTHMLQSFVYWRTDVQCKNVVVWVAEAVARTSSVETVVERC